MSDSDGVDGIDSLKLSSPVKDLEVVEIFEHEKYYLLM